MIPFEADVTYDVLSSSHTNLSMFINFITHVLFAQPLSCSSREESFTCFGFSSIPTLARTIWFDYPFIYCFIESSNCSISCRTSIIHGAFVYVSRQSQLIVWFYSGINTSRVWTLIIGCENGSNVCMCGRKMDRFCMKLKLYRRVNWWKLLVQRTDFLRSLPFRVGRECCFYHDERCNILCDQNCKQMKMSVNRRPWTCVISIMWISNVFISLKFPLGHLSMDLYLHSHTRTCVELCGWTFLYMRYDWSAGIMR